MTAPTLPYPEPGGEEHTAGWSGSDASHDRAVRERDDGTVTKRQRLTLALLDMRGARGATWHEVAACMDWHHGQASGVLSVLHKEGHIARLVERRGRSSIYVGLDYVRGRPTAEHKANRTA